MDTRTSNLTFVSHFYRHLLTLEDDRQRFDETAVIIADMADEIYNRGAICKRKDFDDYMAVLKVAVEVLMDEHAPETELPNLEFGKLVWQPRKYPQGRFVATHPGDKFPAINEGRMFADAASRLTIAANIVREWGQLMSRTQFVQACWEIEGALTTLCWTRNYYDARGREW